MTPRARKIGILGGTFNPVHFGHLALAEAALRRFRLDEVWFIPCAKPPHKRVPKLASDRDRLAMLRAALRGRPRFRLLDLELRRGGVSYSVETLRTLRRRFPGARFYFIIGADMLPGLHAWRDIRSLLRLCRFVTMHRPGALHAARVIRLPAPLRARVKSGFFEGPALNISSSAVRSRAQRGLSIEHLVPAAVARYIKEKGLYRGKGKTPSKH
jgi:nicotinate-nucleotide adenylyltransferase